MVAVVLESIQLASFTTWHPLNLSLTLEAEAENLFEYFIVSPTYVRFRQIQLGGGNRCDKITPVASTISRGQQLRSNTKSRVYENPVYGIATSNKRI